MTIFPIPYRSQDIKNILEYCDIDGAGSDEEPWTTKWCQALATGIGEMEGVSLIDWGCGYGRFLNYMLTENVRNFRYYGFELKGKRGLALNDFNQNYLPLNDDHRTIKFGFVDNQDLIDEAVQNCSTILLGSVFTHMRIEDCVEFLNTFDEVTKKGSIVFSLIMDTEYFLGPPALVYEIENSYCIVRHTEKELDMLTIGGKYKIVKCCDFLTSHKEVHTIFHLTYA
jgi:hypothetical protein